MDHRSRIRFAVIAALAVQAAGLPARAQSTLSPQADWNGSYGFSSSADKNLRILQSDLIKKEEEGYYESLGQTRINAYNTITYDNSTGTVTNSTTNEIGQQTTAIGVVNSSTNKIDIQDSDALNISTNNNALSKGCQDGRVSIDSSPLASDAASCN